MPVDEAVAQIELRVTQLNPSKPSADAIAEIRDAIAMVRSRLGDSMDDEGTLDTGSEDRLAALEQRLESFKG